jgi:hypothetical protein
MRRNPLPLTVGIALLASAIVSGCGAPDSSQESQLLQIALQQTQIALQQTQIALQHPTEAPTREIPTEAPAIVPTPTTTSAAAKSAADPQSYTGADSLADLFDEQITAEEKETLIQFIIGANQDQINTQRYLDISFSKRSHAGYQLLYTQRYLDELKRNGVYKISLFYPEDSYIKDVRVIDDHTIAVDACEYWQDTFYAIKTNKPVQEDPTIVVPQTISIERLRGKLFITGVAFYEGMVFCTDKPADFVPSSKPIGPE